MTLGPLHHGKLGKLHSLDIDTILDLLSSPRPPRHHHHHFHETVAPPIADSRWRPTLLSPLLGVILLSDTLGDPNKNALLLTGGVALCDIANENRGHSPGDERCQTSHGLPRQLRPPSYPAKPVSLRDLLPPVEVRGTTTIALAPRQRIYPRKTNDGLTLV